MFKTDTRAVLTTAWEFDVIKYATNKSQILAACTVLCLDRSAGLGFQLMALIITMILGGGGYLPTSYKAYNSKRAQLFQSSPCTRLVMTK